MTQPESHYRFNVVDSFSSIDSVSMYAITPSNVYPCMRSNTQTSHLVRI